MRVGVSEQVRDAGTDRAQGIAGGQNIPGRAVVAVVGQRLRKDALGLPRVAHPFERDGKSDGGAQHLADVTAPGRECHEFFRGDQRALELGHLAAGERDDAQCFDAGILQLGRRRLADQLDGQFERLAHAAEVHPMPRQPGGGAVFIRAGCERLGQRACLERGVRRRCGVQVVRGVSQPQALGESAPFVFTRREI